MSARNVSDRTLRIAGWSCAAVALLLVATVPLSWSGGVATRPGVAHGLTAQDVMASIVVLSFAFSGAALVHARPRNWIGWILLAVGILQAVQISTDAYGARALTDPDGSLPFGLAAMWVASWAWLPAVLLPLTVLPSIYPTGHAPSRFWRWHVRAGLLGIGLLVVTSMTTQGGIDDTVEGTRLPWDAPAWWTAIVGLGAVGILIPAMAVTIVGTVVRALRAHAPERQQLVWLISVVAAMLATVFLPVDYVFGIAYVCVPIAVVVGVLRYRLLGIEVVLRRTLLYAPLTLLVALTIGGLTTLLARLVPEGPVALVLASGVVAVLVLPAATFLRRAVDRFVLGDRADPLTLVDRVGAGLEVATHDPVPSMLEAVATAAGAAYAQVTDQDGRELAAVGEFNEATLDLPLRHSGDHLGTLRVGPRHGAHRVEEDDARLVAALAPHLAVVVRSQRLTEELAQERERVTAATLAERDRLRRDLHDGLGPSLSGIALGLQAATSALGRDPSAVPELLDRTRSEAESAVREIRRVIDGLRPAALDREGLLGAVQETASSLGLGHPGGPEFALRTQGLTTLPPDVEEAAFRIIAESLTNVARHSCATRCTVQLEQHNGDLRVGVADDGTGVPARVTSGHGLDSMMRRAADLGGWVVIEPAQPHGTIITAVFPTGPR